MAEAEPARVPVQVVPPAPLLVQRECACGGECEDCVRKRESGPETVLHRLADVRVQPKLTIGAPGDRYEQEAERVADAVARGGGDVAEPLAEMLTPVLQRQAEGEEDEDEQLEEAPEEGEAEPEREKDEEPPSELTGVQRKAATPAPPSPPPGFGSRLADATRGGEPLTAEPRRSLERALGARLDAVRVHHDRGADELARSIGAAAFTHGTHIYFREGRFDPAGAEGTHLLAHELAHVVQQSPALAAGAAERLALAPAPPTVIRRAEEEQPGEASAPAEEEKVGWVTLFVEGELIAQPLRLVQAPDILALPPGVYPAVLTLTSLQVVVPGGEAPPPLSVGSDAPVELKKLLQRRPDVFVTITDPSGRSAQAPAGTRPAERLPGEGRPGEGGSKYGVFGLIKGMPPEAVKLLEQFAEMLNGTAELQAMSDLLRTLKSLTESSGSIDALLDPDRLLDVLLGLQESAALDALERWALSAPPPRAAAAKAADRRMSAITRGDKRLSQVLAKLRRLLNTSRRVLRPVFITRGAFVSAYEAASAVLERVPEVEELLELVESGGARNLERLVDKAADKVVAELHADLQRARATLDVGAALAAKQDFVTYDDLAAALASVIAKAAPKNHIGAAIKLAMWTGAGDLLVRALLEQTISREELERVNQVIGFRPRRDARARARAHRRRDRRRPHRGRRRRAAGAQAGLPRDVPAAQPAPRRRRGAGRRRGRAAHPGLALAVAHARPRRARVARGAARRRPLRAADPRRLRVRARRRRARGERLHARRRGLLRRGAL